MKIFKTKLKKSPLPNKKLRDNSLIHFAKGNFNRTTTIRDKNIPERIPLIFRHELCNRIEEQEDELEETMQKYRQVVDQKNREQSEMVQLSSDLESMRTEKNLLEERVRALQLANESYEHNYIEKTSLVRAEARMR